MGDVEIEDKYFGCKRRKAIPRWVLPEKQEEGVFFRQDRGNLMVSIPAELLFFMMSMIKNSIQEQLWQKKEDQKELPEQMDIKFHLEDLARERIQSCHSQKKF